MKSEEPNSTAPSNRWTSDTILAQAAYIERLEAQVAQLQRTIREDTLIYAEDIESLIHAIAGEWRLLTVTLDHLLQVTPSLVTSREHREVLKHIEATREHSANRQYSLAYLHEEMVQIMKLSRLERHNAQKQ